MAQANKNLLRIRGNNSNLHSPRIEAESSTLPVPPVPGTWPPSWLADLGQSASAVEEEMPEESVGWQLPNGTVICGCCNTQPEGAIKVSLVGKGHNRYWKPVPQDEVEADSALHDQTSTESGDIASGKKPIVWA